MPAHELPEVGLPLPFQLFERQRSGAAVRGRCELHLHRMQAVLGEQLKHGIAFDFVEPRFIVEVGVVASQIPHHGLNDLLLPSRIVRIEWGVRRLRDRR